MKYLKLVWLSFLLIAFCLAFSWGSNAIAEQEEGEGVCFHWAFGAKVGPMNNRSLIAVKRDMALKTGDELKMFVEIQTKCFVYLLYRESQGQLHMLFPYDLRQHTTDSKMLKHYYIPEVAWFELDENIGSETFYLLASDRRLNQLERLTKNYGSTEPAKKKELEGQIISEIRRLRRQNRELKAFPERPVQIVGGFRGKDDAGKAVGRDVRSLAVEISAKKFYSRTFTIDHRK
ncbi:MAG: DUF4384 domain-containing protein [Deltaproteobacteria bacterium]|nr:DUF4384 domain-containing protein [Deltaproteobacteria bacterium]